MLTRRTCLAALCSIGGALAGRRACAEGYPSRPIRVIVPYSAGGATDTLARLVGARIEQDVGQRLLIDNRGGGASLIGTQAIATATADGYTVGMIDSAFTINPGLFGRLPYDTRKDFAPVSLIATAPLVLVVHSSVAADSVQALIVLAKSKPDGITFALPGLGTPVHLAAEQMRAAAGMSLVYVPYRGAGPAIADFIAGQVQVTFATVPSIAEHVRAGRARALAIIGARSPLLPGVPSMAEVGLGGIDAALMFGFVAPAATAAPIVARLAELAAHAVTTDPLRARLVQLGYEPAGSDPATFAARIAADIVKWTRIIEAGNIRPI